MLRPYVVLAALWVVYFHPLILHPGQVLYADYSDFLAEHLPAKRFLNREWRETGELPLWNPYHFCGSPFVHDIQVGCFYPPYAVTYLVPEGGVGVALSWVIALHVLAAGVFAHVYARSTGLGEVGSLVAAIGFMFSAKWMTHMLLAGHTITVGLAWLPLVLLGLDRAARSGGVWPVVGAGVAFALLVLGAPPQWALYAGVLAAAWTVPADRSRRSLLRWLACGLGVVAVAGLLCAVQLLPTAEAAGQSARTVGVEASGSLSLALPTFLGLIGPSLTNDPPRSWEVRGVFGACWLAAALAAPKLAGGRAGWRLGVFLAMVFFSVGGAALVEWLPGFNLFRVPGRMLLLAALPLAFLAGATTDALIRSGWGPADRAAVRRSLLLVALVAVVPAAAVTLAGWWGTPGRVAWPAGFVGWVCILVALPCALWLCRRRSTGAPGWQSCTAAWLVGLLAELLGPTILLPEVRPQSAIDPGSETLRFLTERAKPGEGRVLDSDRDESSLLGTGAPLSMTRRIETIRGYNPLDVRYYRELLGFVTDEPGPLRGNSPLTQQVVPNFEVANRELLNLMNVRYVAQPVDQRPPDPPALPVLTDPGPPAVPPLLPHHGPWLPPHVVYENPAAYPRAWVVPKAVPMPACQELEALKACDFRRTVLLTTAEPLPPNQPGLGGAARVTGYRPNRVTVQLDGAAGFLVLGDVWFPGWTCRVDGTRVPVYRANHAFRAVSVPAGAREAVFTFEPRSYRVGWWVSAVTAGLVGAAGLAPLLRSVANRGGSGTDLRSAAGDPRVR